MSTTHTQTFEVTLRWDGELEPSTNTRGLRSLVTRTAIRDALSAQWKDVEISQELTQDEVVKDLSPQEQQDALYQEAVSIVTDLLMNDEELGRAVHKMVVNSLGYSADEIVEEDDKYDLFYCTWSLIMQRVIGQVVVEMYNPYPFGLAAQG